MTPGVVIDTVSDTPMSLTMSTVVNQNGCHWGVAPGVVIDTVSDTGVSQPIESIDPFLGSAGGAHTPPK